LIESYPCPRCDGSLLEPLKDQPAWLRCPSCDYRETLEKLQEAEKRSDRNMRASIGHAMFMDSVNRPHEPGGGDDGLSVIIEQRSLDTGVIRRRIKRKNKVIRVKNLECTSAEATEALHELFLEEEV
jgi:hypothetical protein